MKKNVNPNFFGGKPGGGFGGQENFVVGAENYKPPPAGFQSRGTAKVPDPKAVSAQAEGQSKSLIAAYKRAKQSGTFICVSHNLKQFPSELANFADMTIPGENWWDGYDLTKVDVSNNEIAEVPAELGKQEFVKHLNLNTNLLKELPGPLFTMQSLSFLDISYNKVGHLPEEIGLAKSLAVLKASGNQLTHLP